MQSEEVAGTGERDSGEGMIGGKRLVLPMLASNLWLLR